MITIKQTQQEIVYKIVLDSFPIRTEQLKRLADKEGVSCGDRYLRWLREKGKVDFIKLKKDRTKTWFPVEHKQAMLEYYKKVKAIKNINTQTK